MNTPTTAIDYDRLAQLAKDTGVAFDRLCRRAEEDGARTDQELLKGLLRQPNAEWLSTPDAALHISITYTSFVSTMMRGDLPCFGIECKSRSRNNPNSRRGCGVLYKRSDLDDVVRLRRAMGSSTVAALRVFQAVKKGVITLVNPQDDASSEAA